MARKKLTVSRRRKRCTLAIARLSLLVSEEPLLTKSAINALLSARKVLEECVEKI